MNAKQYARAAIASDPDNIARILPTGAAREQSDFTRRPLNRYKSADPELNATASASPIRATTPAPVDVNEKSAAPFRPRTAVKARIDDGRYNGFHQGGGDQPAGDQQVRPADRIQVESKRLSRKSGERVTAPAQAGSTPATHDQSTIVRTQ